MPSYCEKCGCLVAETKQDGWVTEDEKGKLCFWCYVESREDPWEKNVIMCGNFYRKEDDNESKTSQNKNPQAKTS